MALGTFYAPKALSRLTINPGEPWATITVDSQAPVPNWWYRFWYKVLLGWTWKRLND